MPPALRFFRDPKPAPPFTVKDLENHHATHLVEARPQLARYFGLPPGWQFFLTGQGENVQRVA